MTDTLTTAAAVQQALNEAAAKASSGHLYKANDDAAADHDWNQGDPETVYSLASLYSQFATDPAAAEEAILQALTEKYGEDYL